MRDDIAPDGRHRVDAPAVAPPSLLRPFGASAGQASRPERGGRQACHAEAVAKAGWRRYHGGRRINRAGRACPGRQRRGPPGEGRGLPVRRSHKRIYEAKADPRSYALYAGVAIANT